MTTTLPATTIGAVRPDERAAVLSLLGRHGLPIDGLADHWDTTLVARRSGQVVGSAAVELYADGALLRSVAVMRECHGQGLGQALTQAALAHAASHGTAVVYLLTTTADRFFPKFGFETIDRSDVPASVRSSVEFTSACPASAIVMRKLL